MEDRDTMDQKRDDAGFKSEVSATEQTSLNDNKDAFVTAAFTGYKAAESTSSRRRRRRSTSKFPFIYLLLLWKCLEICI